MTAYVCGQMHRYSLYQLNQDGTYQLNVAESLGYGTYDCFVVVNANTDTLNFDVYRNFGGSSFNLAHSKTLNKTIPADINSDGSVDFNDLLIMSEEWLLCI